MQRFADSTDRRQTARTDMAVRTRMAAGWSPLRSVGSEANASFKYTMTVFFPFKTRGIPTVPACL